MSFQLEVVKFRDTVVVTSLNRFVPNIQPLTLEVTGEDFSSVDEVLVNDTRAPEFLILNKTTMWVQLPDTAQTRIDTIEVISSRFTTVARSKLSFRLGPKTQLASGVQKLTQLFVKWMLQSPGSDLFNPQRGGGLQELAGKVTTTRKMEPIIASVTRSVNNTTMQIQKAQTAIPNLPMSERLLSADITEFNVSTQLMEARLRVSLRAMSGERALASIQL